METVTLRRFELSDVDAMMAWASDPEVAAFCRWEPYESTEPLLAYLRDTRVVGKAGFRREGVLRRHYWHKGRVRDLVMYSFISSDLLT
uniref:N-acetyltransferase domain-containing protein n=1 Tax=Oryza brachyantha TaxID=4533 RepID=J3LTM7_ORYBR